LVQITADNKIHIKILYWGIAGCGKTTAVDTLYRMTKEQDKGIEPVGNLTKISSASGATLYFDRGIFHSKKSPQVYYRIFTVAGQVSFAPLREKIFQGTDGVIFVVDSQTQYTEDNIESLKELKSISEGRLITEIPMIVMLNKQDLPEIIKEVDFARILKEEKLWYGPENQLAKWNPLIYETCALFNKKRDIFRSFSECARRTGLYQIYGDGKAPLDKIM
jgi:signal recognition particle receptor subunit beta